MKAFLFVLAVALTVVTIRAAVMVNSFERSAAWSTPQHSELAGG